MPPATQTPPVNFISQALARCNECLQRKDFDAALAAISEAVKRAPQNADLRCYRGRIASVMGRLEEARADFDAALKVAPRNAGVHSGLARLFLLQNDLANAELSADKALSLSPADEEGQQVKQELQALRAKRQPLTSAPATADGKVGLGSIADVTKTHPSLDLEDLLKRNRHFKNLHAGQRCFIVGNGPSTQYQNLIRLKDEITIAVNDFARNPGAASIQSPYWVLADPLYWEQPQVHFLPVAQLAVDQALSPQLFVPTTGFSYFNAVRAGPLINYNYFHFSQATIATEIDFTQGIPTYGQNVILVALMLAFHLGCNPIYLIGVDHDILKLTEEQYADYASAHSYKKPTAAHGKLSDQMTWEQWQGAKARMLFQYGELKTYAARRGIEVRDATCGGHLEVFPKDDYDSLFVGDAGQGKLVRENRPPVGASRVLAEAARKLLDAGEALPALSLLDDAFKQNRTAQARVAGIQYLRALALARLGRLAEALLAAREDLACNPANRALAEPLIGQLEAELAA